MRLIGCVSYQRFLQGTLKYIVSKNSKYAEAGLVSLANIGHTQSIVGRSVQIGHAAAIFKKDSIPLRDVHCFEESDRHERFNMNENHEESGKAA